MIALCHDCKHRHSLRPANAPQDWLDWQAKHPKHKIDLVAGPHPRDWQRYTHNANVNIAYGASATITVAPENIASSATFVAGVESAVIDNTSNKYVDALVGGRWTVGTTPTINTQALIYVFSVQNDTPDYPDVFDGTGSAETLTSAGVGRGFLKLAAVIDVDATTSDRVYHVLFSVAQLFGGVMPLKWGLFITHNTGVNTNTTAGNHVWKLTGITYTVA